NGRGYYTWETDKRGKQKKTFDPAVMDILKPGVKGKKDLSAEDIVERMMLPMVVEASRCLEEGIVDTPVEVDMGLVLGLGFPPFRGGLLRYADSLGLATLVAAAQKHAALGYLYTPTRQMQELAKKSAGFYPPLA
ncbi:MAG: 3-hydroxyacyl-CoA dehydrogenase family protein, partial [Deltaproteobacteria bacterium]|nr:3-hydroxyacyl-CoA dehydrogenase family protein [Deltaproteobacteria bacterium]